MLNLQTYIDQEIITKDFKSTLDDEFTTDYLDILLEASHKEDPYISDYFILKSLEAVNDVQEKLKVLNRPRTPIYLGDSNETLNQETFEEDDEELTEIFITKFTYKAYPNEEGNTIFDLTNPNHNLEILKSYIEQEWYYIWDLNTIDEDYQIFEYDKESKTLTIYLVGFE